MATYVHSCGQAFQQTSSSRASRRLYEICPHCLEPMPTCDEEGLAFTYAVIGPLPKLANRPQPERRKDWRPVILARGRDWPFLMQTAESSTATTGRAVAIKSPEKGNSF